MIKKLLFCVSIFFASPVFSQSGLRPDFGPAPSENWNVPGLGPHNGFDSFNSGFNSWGRAVRSPTSEDAYRQHYYERAEENLRDAIDLQERADHASEENVRSGLEALTNDYIERARENVDRAERDQDI